MHLSFLIYHKFWISFLDCPVTTLYIVIEFDFESITHLKAGVSKIQHLPTSLFLLYFLAHHPKLILI